MEKVYYVFILTTRLNSTLYTGVTHDLMQYIRKHKRDIALRFTTRLNVNKLVYYEIFKDSKGAIQRERSIKRMSRTEKEKLIKAMNPEWSDLYETKASSVQAMAS